MADGLVQLRGGRQISSNQCQVVLLNTQELRTGQWKLLNRHDLGRFLALEGNRKVRGQRKEGC